MKDTLSYRSLEDYQIEQLRQRPLYALSYLNAAFQMAFEENEPELMLVALAKVAKSRGMTRVAKDAELQRESLHRMLSKRGNPEWSSLFRVFKALGLRPHLEPTKEPH